MIILSEKLCKYAGSKGNEMLLRPSDRRSYLPQLILMLPSSFTVQRNCRIYLYKTSLYLRELVTGFSKLMWNI